MKLLGDSHIGAVRTANQDCFACKQLGEELAYAIVCDGMGGAAGGQIASQMVMEEVRRRLERELTSVPLSPRTLRGMLESAAAAANCLVFDRSRQEEGLQGMGTTLVITVVYGDTACILHVGDSRVYSFFPGTDRLEQLTRDHSLVQMLLEQGEITAQEAKTHPKRNRLTRAVGVEPTVDISYQERDLEPEECLLLCSDGLYNFVQEEKLPALLTRSAQQEDPSPLIGEANRSGGGDNITAVLFVRGSLGGNANG